jgi:hypothetical protein
MLAWFRATAMIAVACAGSAMAGCGGSAGASPSVTPTARSTGSPFRFFSPSSPWNEEVSASASLDPTSASRIARFGAEITAQEQAGIGPWINYTSSGIPVYLVPARQPTVRVKLVEHSPNAAMSAAWRAVPMPPDAVPSSGSDRTLVVWQPSTQKLWEFHHLIGADGSWRASWGGAIRHVSSSRGVYGPRAWPGAQSWWGVSASSMSLVGGMISLEDLERGTIDHALAMAIPIRAGAFFAYPAQRTDGISSDPLAMPEGAHLRLNPKLDLATLHLSRLTLMIAEAAQRYGIYVTDGTGRSGVSTFFAEDPGPSGTEPYGGPGGYLEGTTPAKLLSAFPWSELQLLKMHLRSVASVRRERRSQLARSSTAGTGRL